jgi:hypothetical protein
MRRQLLGKSHRRHIPYIANQLNGTFTNSAEGTFNSAGNIAQRAARAVKLVFEITGTVTFDMPCDPAQSSPH